MAGTRWVKIDTSYLRNPKIVAVSTQAALLHLASILWTADQLTDGNIPRHVLPDLAHMARVARSSAPRRADELVKAGLWESNSNGWHLHDFEAMNRQALRANVERQRREWRQRQEKLKFTQ
jgi:hypothetical protein